jgi:hypothetical protein
MSSSDLHQQNSLGEHVGSTDTVRERILFSPPEAEIDHAEHDRLLSPTDDSITAVHDFAAHENNIDDRLRDESWISNDQSMGGRRSPRPHPTALRRFSLTEEDETRTDRPEPAKDDPAADEKPKPVSWSQLPKRGQLLILTLARLSEPLTQTSLQAYLFYQLKSFDPTLPDSTISWQAGILQGSFTAAQFLTAVWWGRLADASWMGRKRILLIGLTGTCLSSLGFGFSRSFVSAVVFRTLGGLMNSNVGVMRTMIAEIIEEKKLVCPARPLPMETDFLGINPAPFCFFQCASILVSLLAQY